MIRAEDTRVCLATPELLNNFADELPPSSEYGRLGQRIRVVALESKPWPEWISGGERAKDLDRLCVLAAGILAHTGDVTMPAVDSIAATCDFLLSRLKARVKA